MRRPGEPFVVADEKPPSRFLLAPNQGSREVQCVGRAEPESFQLEIGLLAHLLGGLNFPPGRKQIV